MITRISCILSKLSKEDGPKVELQNSQFDRSDDVSIFDINDTDRIDDFLSPRSGPIVPNRKVASLKHFYITVLYQML